MPNRWPRWTDAPPLLDDVWSALAVRWGKALRAGLDDVALEAAAQALGFRLPVTLRALYSRHDGEDEPHGVFAGLPKPPIRGVDLTEFRWLPLNQAVVEREAAAYGYGAEYYTDWLLVGRASRATIWVYPPDERLFIATKSRLEPMGLDVSAWVQKLV